jgi:hypothetical protein
MIRLILLGSANGEGSQEILPVGHPLFLQRESFQRCRPHDVHNLVLRRETRHFLKLNSKIVERENLGLRV